MSNRYHSELILIWANPNRIAIWVDPISNWVRLRFGSEQHYGYWTAFMEGVHLSLIPELGNKVRRAFIEGVHLESVHLERVDCM